jgi:DNA polymerase/3'-5' exonuclease PolX
MNGTATLNPPILRIPRELALDVADELLAILMPYCERIEIAGSIRRKKTTVKDIELVYIPKMEGSNNALLLELDALVFTGVIEKRLNHERGTPEAWGPKHQRALYKGVPIDLFGVPDPDCWGVIFAIRTGPAEYSQQLVTRRESGGRFLLPGMKVEDGTLWDDGKPVPCPEETDFFNYVGKPYVNPEDRI